MKYDFTSIIDRRGKDASSADRLGMAPGFSPEPPQPGFDAISMWVADMNFATCPAIPEAMIERAKHPLYGYFFPRDEYFESIIRWRTTRDGYQDLKREYIGYENGVHGCVSSAVQTFSAPGDKILLHSPVYVGFTNDVEGLGRTSIYSALKKDENGVWRMDFEDMDAKLKKYNIHLAIFCSPHNPAGRVWERWELEKALEVFERNECYVISDEIWADIVYAGHKHTPTLMVNDWAKDHVIGIYAPSKTFNLAGLVGSYHIIYNKYLRDRIKAFERATHYNEMNVLSMHALMAGYSEQGTEWLGELLEVLEDNCKYAYEHIRTHYEGVDVSMPEGTYMLFLNCASWLEKNGKTLDELLKAGWDVGVGWQDGRRFEGPTHIRMNLASPKSRIIEAFDRLDKYVFNV